MGEKKAKLVEALLGSHVTRVEADAPFAKVRLVTDRFGKRTLSDAPCLKPAERRHRTNRLEEIVTYVLLLARRVAPGRSLVVSNESVGQTFAKIPSVEVAHFNAVAGLDVHRDVALLVFVGRSLPPEPQVGRLCGAFFGQAPSGGWRAVA